jgi:hypothetical protein
MAENKLKMRATQFRNTVFIIFPAQSYFKNE